MKQFLLDGRLHFVPEFTDMGSWILFGSACFVLLARWLVPRARINVPLSGIEACPNDVESQVDHFVWSTTILGQDIN